ncbi:hypothetical protein ABB37_02935 [Leptomonas pyrrhocoris]|uniref:PNPLA domain-containing protein n=1 Tax=Leptomonas pyrrhocoris TaxID=157538 RepID=A0A0M9G6A4_LEPPY|nr:hypothetical protein ABB37_02935 [Leptomonas pyrrhocoris]KPA83257.1 hypothetical protein ABB37_02935 [Leptomonas pyrrhocoris]|eukprot:XP_015661696.1 hypothetical protein ABB37_02935 [Leptomonas pyrrhocoris]
MTPTVPPFSSFTKTSLPPGVVRLSSFISRGVWRVLHQMRFLTVIFRLVQHVLFRVLAVLQYINDFPLRMQFRRTTRRFLSVMNTTEDYATFVDAAASLDHYCGVAQWAQEAPPLVKCDAVGLLADALAAQQLVETNNVAAMEVFLCSLLKRNAHGLMDPSIYNFFNCPKHCIEDYTTCVEELIVAYATAAPSDGDSAAGESPPTKAKKAGKANAAAAAAATPHQLRPCWMRMDALQSQRSGDKAPHFPFSFQWEASKAMTSAAAAAAAGVKPLPSSTLPTVDITAKIQHAWWRTLSARGNVEAARHASPPPSAASKVFRFHSMSRYSSDAGGDICSPHPHSAASTIAPTSERSVGGGGGGSALAGTRSGASRLCVGFASAGEVDGCMGEEDVPHRSASAAPRSSVAPAEADFDKRKGEARSQPNSRSLISLGVLTKPQEPVTVRAAVRSGATDSFSSPRITSPASLPHAESALLAHIDTYCASLHRFMDSSASVTLSPLLPSPRPSPPTQRRICILRQVLRSFGRTALVLSGGASMGTYHAGVARALYEAGVMPDILSGSSAGSIIASLICSKTPAELHSFIQSHVLSTEAMQMSPFGEDVTLGDKLHRFFKTGFLMDVRTFMECMRGQIGDLTFREAFELSGKVLNVSVTRSQHEGTHADRHALLNYVTAPDVVIWSAVSASCALPGLFTAVQLIEKPPSAAGSFAPYLPGELWCDGSVAQDVPRRLLTQLFGVNYFIVSQVNPHVIPFLQPPPSYLVVTNSSSVLTTMWFATVALWGWLLTVLFSLRFLSINGPFELLFLAFAQDYGGDVSIHPVESLLTAVPDYLNLVNNPSAEYISYVSSRAQCRTWPLVTRIRFATTIERRLLRELQRLESAAYAKSKEYSNIR